MDQADTAIFKSNKGINDKIFHHGFEYLKDGHSKNKTAMGYCCSSYKSLKCPGRLIYYPQASDNEKYKVTKEHIHVGDGSVVRKAAAMHSLKRKAVESLESGRNVVAKVNDNMDVATAATLAKSSSLVQAVRRRRINLDHPKNPTSLTELVIPERLKLVNQQVFLLHDSGPGPNRIIIYSTVRNLDTLKYADVIAIDGTFDIVPPLFEQMYTMQGRVNGWYVPLVYALLPNKKKVSYDEMFKVVSNYVPDLKPKYIISDFEVGAISAAKKYWPQAKSHGCFFHLCQSVWRHVRSIGLQSRYVNDPNFAVGIRQLMALAFVPPHDIVKRFEELCASNFWMEKENDGDSAKLQELLLYFESMYIGVPMRDKSKRKSVSFPPCLWSVFEITVAGLPRTNNSLEAWHGVLKRTVGASHPTIFKFLEALQMEQKFQELRIAKVISGHAPEVTPKKYREINARILATVKEYATLSEQGALGYLTAIAHNISF